MAAQSGVWASIVPRVDNVRCYPHVCRWILRENNRSQVCCCHNVPFRDAEYLFPQAPGQLFLNLAPLAVVPVDIMLESAPSGKGLLERPETFFAHGRHSLNRPFG